MAQEDTAAFLKELLLSYRILYGQDKASRKLFKSWFSEQNMSGSEDFLLATLCGKKSSPLGGVFERQVYSLQLDCPFFQSRMAVLAHVLNARKPHGWRQLLRDRRDSPSWYTFWAVIIIGFFGLLFSLLQVLLQVVQIYKM